MSQETTLRLEQLPPIHSIEAERSVLGAMLSDPQSVIGQAEERIQATDFFHPAHAALYSALVEMNNMGQPIDPSTVLQYLEDRKLADSVGGAPILGALSAGVISVLTAPTHIETVRSKSLLRQLQNAACQIAYDAQECQHQPDEVIGRAESLIQRVSDISIGSNREQTVKSARDCAIGFVDNAEKLHGKKNTYNGIPTGFYQLDLLLKGFQPAEYIALAAKPGLGKTAFMLNLVLNMAKSRKDPETGATKMPGHRVGVFSIEMNHLQLTNRIISMISLMPSGHVRTPQAWTAHDYDKMSIAAENFAGLPITIDADGYMTPEKFRARARWMKKSRDVEIIFVDYLQLMNLSGKVNGDYDIELSRQASETIRQSAKELGIPIVVLLQFNKDGIRNSRPTMADIKGSGKIIQDAHNILIMHEVENADRRDGDPLQIQITIDKARESEKGTYRQYDYDGKIYTFKERQSAVTSGRETYDPR